MAGPFVLSTGVIDNRAPATGVGRPARSLVIRVENNGVTAATPEGVPIVVLEVFTVNPADGGFGSQSTYALNQVALADVNQPSSTFTIDNVFADLDTYGVRCTITTTGSTLPSIPTVTVFSRDAQGTTISSRRLYAVTLTVME